MLRTKKQVDRVRLFLRPSSAYFAFGNSIRKDAPKVGEEYKSCSTVVVFLLLSVLSTVLFLIGEVYQNYWNLFKFLERMMFLKQQSRAAEVLYYFSQDHLVASLVAARLLEMLICQVACNVRPLNCLKQPSSHQIRHMSINLTLFQ